MPASNRLLRPAVAIASVALVTTLTATLATVPAASEPGSSQPRTAAQADRRSSHPGQTSDGVPGLEVGPPVAARGSRVRTKNDVTYQVAPGVTVREWIQVDGRQPVGQVSLNLMSIDLDAPDISFEYLSSKYVPKTKPVSFLADKYGALAAVNGDFFDISDTGAPLGIGISQGKRVRTGTRKGWIPENRSLWFDKSGEPHVGPLSVRYKIRQRRGWRIDGVNAATVPARGIGLYTKDWGWTKGTSVTNGRKNAREVHIVGKRVRSNRYGVSKGRKVKGYVLVGRGREATRQLKQLKKGMKVTFFKLIRGGKPQMAITGDRPVLVDGVQTVINDRLAHPRTAVGIDADGRRLLLLVVDGRSSTSRGHTMVELAQMMAALGAENALNLDGGGSSTMYSLRSTGELGTINTPSDGAERRVPNALGVMYTGATQPAVTFLTTPPG